MRRAIRFRLRTLLALLSLVALIGGGGRYWYNARLAEYERQRLVAERLEARGASIYWSYVGPSWLEAWKALDGPLFRRPTHAYGESVPQPEFAAAVEESGQIDMTTLVVLGRQIMPHAYETKARAGDAVIERLRRHRTLKRLVVDASIRGAPLEYDAPLYTREDKSLLEELLPNVRIDWIEVN
jgi:hypothetical protein